jgi:hypothetical protein
VKPLPVIATIREAYQFTFANLGAIIGLIWLPMVLYTVGEFFVTQNFGARVQEAIAAGNPNAAGPAVLAVFLFALVGLALNAMMFTAVTQLALGQRQGGAMFHFSFGALEWRVFRNLFGVALFLLPGYLLFILTNGHAATANPSSPQGAAALIAAVALVCGLIYFVVRLTALLLPVTLSEEKSAFIRCWALTAGNFWRLLGVFLGVMVPLYLFVVFAMAAIIGSGLTPGTMPTADQVSELRDANLPLISGLSFLVAPFMIGFMVSASAFSWRALSRTDILA